MPYRYAVDALPNHAQFIFIVIFTCFTTLSSTAKAQANSAAEPVVVTLNAYKVQIKADGKEALAPAKEVVPGDVIEYVVVYRNQSKAAARNVYATLPVPPGGLSYLPDSALPATADASLDGNTYAPIPLMRTRQLADGTRQNVTVPPTEYRYLRWPLGDIEPGKSKTVKARMRL